MGDIRQGDDGYVPPPRQLPTRLHEIRAASAVDFYRPATGGQELARPVRRPRLDEVVAQLGKKRRQRGLVEFMADRRTATFEEIAREVHRYPGTEDSTVRSNVSRTNDSLKAMGAPFEFRDSDRAVTKYDVPG
jgi:hypothetical protein